MANWGKKPRLEKANTLDEFVAPGKKTKRLNADIPLDLHIRVKAGCALEGKDITSVIIELLEARFPKP